MKKISLLTLLVYFISCVTLFAQSNLKVKTIDGKKCSLHKVLPKETWTSVSKKFNLTIDEIKSVNRGINDLKIGQIINIPESSTEAKQKPVGQAEVIAEAKTAEQNKKSPQVFTHAVSQGETLYGIAKQYLVSVDDLKKWNNMKSNSAKIGQIIFVSDPTKSNIALSEKTKADITFAEPKKENKSDAVKSVHETKPVDHTKPSTETKNNKPVNAEPTKVSETKASTALVDINSNQAETKNPVFADASDKIIAVSSQKEESVYKPSVRNSKGNKSKNGNSVVEMNESGMAASIKDGDINQNKFYGLHRNAPLGTIIKVTNRMNEEYVFVKIVGQLPDTGDNDKQIIKISEAAAKRIGAINEKFQVDLSYGMLQ